MELRDYLKIMRAHLKGAIVIVVVVVLAGMAYTATRTKVYAANASGFVSTGPSDNPALGSVNDQLAKSRATSYVDIAKSRATARQAIRALNLDVTPASLVDRITVKQPLDTVLLNITATGDSPREAQTLADAWVAALAEQVSTIEDPSMKLLDGTPRVVPIESAELPTSPVSPNPERNLALAALGGLALAFGYALLRHNLDRRIRDADAIAATFQVPVAGSVPLAKSLGHQPGARAQIVVQQANGFADNANTRGASEAFRMLRTNLMYMDVDSPPRLIVVTSPRAGDGKSTVAANLAAAIAFSGQQVVLVDGDLRRPSVASSLGLLDNIGLTDVLVRSISVEGALQQSAEVPNLSVLAAGHIPPNPSELLGSRAMRATLAALTEHAMVIIDAPPLLPVTDAAILTAHADGALVVVSTGKTLDTELATALANLRAVNGRALGVILNRAERRGADRYRYDDYYTRRASDAVTPLVLPEVDPPVVARRRAKTAPAPEARPAPAPAVGAHRDHPSGAQPAPAHPSAPPPYRPTTVSDPGFTGTRSAPYEPPTSPLRTPDEP